MTSQVDNRLTLVPVIGVYNGPKDEVALRGKAGVTASNITCAPKAAPGERSHGIWKALGAHLELTLGPGDRGPRSGEDFEYKRVTVAKGRQTMMVTDTAIEAAVDGNSSWGPVGDKKRGKLLVWKWSLDDVDELSVVRVRKYLKWWDAQLFISCEDPFAQFRYSGLGDDADPFMARDKPAKAAKTEGSDLLAFAYTVVAVATALGRTVQQEQDDDGDTASFTFRFAGHAATPTATSSQAAAEATPPANSGWAAPPAAVAAPVEPAPAATLQSAPAAWIADPTGRHELRYWDGGRWTEHVADRGAQGTDPL